MTEKYRRLFVRAAGSAVFAGALVLSCSTLKTEVRRAEASQVEAPDAAAASPSPSASAPVVVGEGHGSPEVLPLPGKKHEDKDRGLTVELTPKEAPDGGVVFIRIVADAEKQKSLKVEQVQVSFEGTKYPVFEISPREFGALVAIPFNSNPRRSKVQVDVPGAEALGIDFEVIDGKYRSEILTVDPKFSNPPKKSLKRIVREMKQIGAIYRKTSSERYWKGRFQLPVDSIQTSPFGNKRVFNGELRGFHQGLDLRAAVGTPIVAPEDARVVLSKNLYFTGNCVILDHGHGLYTLYAHMSKLGVKVGQMVKKGQRLGLAGATGRVSGPHLHWGAVLKGAKVNPLDRTRVIP